MGVACTAPVYVDDLVEGVVRAAAVPEAAGRIFTVTGAEPVTIGEFVAHYCRMLGIDPPRSVPAPVARAVAGAIDAVARLRRARNEVTPAAIDYFMRRGTYSIARAREVLGYEPVVDLEEGMRRTEAWLRSEGLVLTTTSELADGLYRGAQIRTGDLTDPNGARYQAALRPDARGLSAPKADYGIQPATAL